jgi:hypothetical protein
MIVFNNDRYLIDICSRNKINISTHLSGSEFTLANELCRSNRYICFGEEAPRKNLDLVSIEIEDMEMYLRFYLIVNKNMLQDDAAKKFIGYAKKLLCE